MTHHDITRLLNDLHLGLPGSRSLLIDALYGELLSMARRRMAAESPQHTLQPTALVHEAYLRLLGDGHPAWENRRHFFGAAAEAMRRVLIDHARAKKAERRGGDRSRDPLLEIALPQASSPIEVEVFNEALTDLEAVDGRSAEVVKLRYLLGFSLSEAAAALGVTQRTVTSDWNYAKAWLMQRLGS